MRDWCVYAMSEYEKWRMMEIDKALKEKRPLPPLCETSYPLLVEWAQKMKDLSGRVIQNGAFNAESSQLSSQLKSFTPTSSPEKDLNMGETTAAVDLSVTVVTAATTSAATFPSPATSKVRKRMDAMESSKPKRKKKADPPSEEDQRRQKVAATVMAKHGITADAATTGKKRCKVCGLIKRNASITTFPFTDCTGSTTTATARGFNASKLVCVLISTPDNHVPKPGCE